MNANTDFSGVYPMTYSFFDEDGELDLPALKCEIEALIAWGASGIAVLGLASEVHKLSAPERWKIVEFAGEVIDGRVPLAVTVSEATAKDQAAIGRHAKASGAQWLILQPARVRDVSEAAHMRFFGSVADAVELPVGMQIAPAYLGQGFSPENLLGLKRQHPNIQLMKTEMTALGVADFIQRTENAFDVFNGQAGVGIIDCMEAGCAGFIPGAETGDVSSAIYRLYASTDERDRNEAVALYRQVLPLWHMIMETIDTLLIYGKPLIADRIEGVNGRVRPPHGATSEFGNARLRALAGFLKERQ